MWQTIVNLLLNAFWYYNFWMVKFEIFLGNWFVYEKPRSEPNFETWNCVCTLEHNRLLEHYSYSNEFKPVSGALCIFKEKNRRLCIVEGTNNTNGSPNNVRFLNVQYMHPNMQSPLKLTFDISYIRNGNEVFSKLFVRRLLGHQYYHYEYVFDDNYELHLMDNSVNKIVIKSNQYMVFDDLENKCGYKIYETSKTQ